MFKSWHILIPLYILGVIGDIITTMIAYSRYGWLFEANPIILQYGFWGLSILMLLATLGGWVFYKVLSNVKTTDMTRYIIIFVLVVAISIRAYVVYHNSMILLDPPTVQEVQTFTESVTDTDKINLFFSMYPLFIINLFLGVISFWLYLNDKKSMEASI